jgi:hypothetical protein
MYQSSRSLQWTFKVNCILCAFLLSPKKYDLLSVLFHCIAGFQLLNSNSIKTSCFWAELKCWLGWIYPDTCFSGDGARNPALTRAEALGMRFGDGEKRLCSASQWIPPLRTSPQTNRAHLCIRSSTENPSLTGESWQRPQVRKSRLFKHNPEVEFL